MATSSFLRQTLWHQGTLLAALRNEGGNVWRLALFTGAVCFILSTQFFFQTRLFTDWPLSIILEGWLDVYLDDLTIGASLAVCIALVERLSLRSRPFRFLGLFAAILTGATLGNGLVSAQEAEFPVRTVFAGEVLRWSILGGLVTLVYRFQKRIKEGAAELHETEIARLNLQRQMTEARLAVLQAQIEPHFLFNTLATVKRLYQTDTSGGDRMLGNLAQYLAAALPQLRESGCTLGREIELVRAYLNVQQIRMGERLRVAIHVPETLTERRFPAMMILTMVENAVKHGLVPSLEGGSIHVDATGEADRLRVVVTDTGVGFRTSSGSGIGLANSRSRLSALYGRDARLSLTSNEPHGVVITIDIPSEAADESAAGTPERVDAAP